MLLGRLIQIVVEVGTDEEEVIGKGTDSLIIPAMVTDTHTTIAQPRALHTRTELSTAHTTTCAVAAWRPNQAGAGGGLAATARHP